MSELPISQILLIVLLAVLLLIIMPIFQSRTGKSLSEVLFGVRPKKKQDEKHKAPAREPRINNGTKGELTAFVAQLLRFAGKNGMRLVAPGTVEYKGEKARLTAFLVAPGGVVGIYCLGFGGTITKDDKPSPWRQHINGEDRTFENPEAVCQKQRQLVVKAMEEAGIQAPLTIVTVFTNARAALVSPPEGVYTPKSLTAYLKENRELKSGGVDMEKTARELAVLAGIKKK